ncbi:MAG: hypothetical protein ACR2OZ_03970 [Verrucomicrobiales bacterium]
MVRIVQRVTDKETVSAAVRLAQTEALITVMPGVDEGASFTCRTGAGESLAKLVFYDTRSHLAVVTVDETRPATLAHADSRSVTLGTSLKIITPDETPGRARFAGRVKQLEGQPLLLTLLRFHSAASGMLPGSAIVDDQHRVVALALSTLDDQGAWLSIPIEAALKVAADIKRFGVCQSGELEVGVAVGTTTPRLEFVKAGSRAERTGLKAGDIILRIGERPVAEAFDILDANFYLTTRDPAQVRVLRGLEELTLTAPAVEKK